MDRRCFHHYPPPVIPVIGNNDALPAADDDWHKQLELEEHIRQCQCSCNHLGYGNYWSYKENLDKVGGGSHAVMSPLSIVKADACYPPWRAFDQLAAAPSIDSLSVNNHFYAHDHNPQGRFPFSATTESYFMPVDGIGMIGPPIMTNGSGPKQLPQNAVDDDSDSVQSRSSSTRIGAGTELSSKQWSILGVVLLVALGTSVGVGVPLALRSGSSLHERMAAAHSILAQVPLVDGHNDLPWNIRKFAGGKINTMRGLETGLQHQEPWSKTVWSHTDLPRLKEGRVGAQFWSAYVPCGAQYLDAVKQTLEQVDLIKRMIDRYPDYLRFAVDAKGIEESHRDGRIASLLGVEGGHSLGNSLAVLRTFYDLGVRYVTLTHTCNTPWADCSVAEADPHHTRSNGGLTNFGRLMVKEMNRLGVIVDLSHASSATMHHALDVSRAPVIFSHSSARALCNITRNVPDEVLRRLVTNGGMVMVSFFSLFVSCNKTTSIQDVVAHINHIRRVAGVDHVGIGAGYDGINLTPSGLEDVSKYPSLFAELLLDPTWSEEDLKKLAGLNFLRVLRQVEKVRDDYRRLHTAADETSIAHEELKGQTQCVYHERSASQSSVT